MLPEAIIEECDILFKFSLNYVKKYSDIKFIWRLHPLLNFKMLMGKLGIKKLPKNIILSKNNNSDFINAKFCLYRGSSSVVEAIRYSCIPMYLELNNSLDINPLINFENLKKIKTLDEFNNFIKTNKFDDLVMEKLKSDVNNYFTESENNFLECYGKY